MTTLMDQIKRAQAAKDGLLLAALLPSAEELADRVMTIDPEASEAEALAFGAHAREATLEVLREHLLEDA
ncbi:MAG: hypothetical protein M3522_03290 [Actinomycetota bacterium]|jgi:hypothetical protein|nr:hypothetical protein [Actinomycetota bacterium]